MSKTGAMAPEYQELSQFLGMEEKELSEDIARLADIIEQSFINKLITDGSQVVALAFSYFVGKGKINDKYRKVLDGQVANLLILLDDYLKFTYDIDLF